MLTEFYIEALLVDEELADQVWDKGDYCDTTVAIAWLLIAKQDAIEIGNHS